MAIITGFKSGKSYTFKNLTTEKMLNLYAPYPAKYSSWECTPDSLWML